MRRSVIILLLLAIAGTPFVPMLAASSQVLPACCRRDGTHHCMAASSGDGFKAAASACPYRRSPATMRSNVAVASAARSWQGVVTSSGLHLHADRAGIVTYSCYSHPKRGPPFA
jgi:hypothetical protein